MRNLNGDNRKIQTLKKTAEIHRRFFGGPDGIRTHDFYNANVALSQLSYKPLTLKIIFFLFIFVKIRWNKKYCLPFLFGQFIQI